jgi:glycosyltransferase involved in cell wall biosynthesis
MNQNQLRVIVAQVGARQHYDIADICHTHGALTKLHTDFWIGRSSPISNVLKRVPGTSARRLLGRNVHGIPDSLVTTHALEALYWRLRSERARGHSGQFEIYRRWGSQFAQSVAKSLNSENFTTLFSFSGASLEALLHARKLGALSVLDEIAPSHLEDEIIAEEQSRFPLLEPHSSPTPASFFERIEAEWDAADRVLVNSNWTKSALLARGVPLEKIYVVPISYDNNSVTPTRKFRSPNEPLRVLWLGTLCLRKGFPYAIEAARQLMDSHVKFTFAGPSTIDLARVNWPDNSQYLGQVPRNDVPSLWRDHDIFLLPTLSDGFAITQIEALAHGLPVIVTSNCGDVIEDRRCGRIVPPRDARSIADAIRGFLDGEISLGDASEAAMVRSLDFSAQAVWPSLKEVLTPSSVLPKKQT